MSPRFETPVLFLIFNRPDTTQRVFNQIKKIKPNYLFVAADGPRENISGEKELCEQTRKVIEHVDWDCEIQTLLRDTNLGVAKAVSGAITWFFSAVQEGIILEDDCYPDETFFPFCTELLAKFRDIDQVKLISGNNFQNGIKRGRGSYYFSHYPEIWGWASWRRVWKEYDFEMPDLNKTVSSDRLTTVYPTQAERNYWLKKFKQTKAGLTNTWDYQLTYSIVKNNGLAISPQLNLVTNIGIENYPSHSSLRDSAKQVSLRSMHFPLVHPETIAPDHKADHYSFFRIYGRSFNRLLRILKENGIKRSFRYILKKLSAK